jgi:hypothetical protein
MEFTLSIVLLLVLLLVFLLVRTRRKTSVTIDGYTVKLWRDRDFVWIVYRDPSTRTLTLEAHDWLGPGNQPEALVDFPTEIAFCEGESSPVKGGAMKLDIQDARLSRISEEEAIFVQERISAGLTRLKIRHEFTRPRRSGWSSFENGREIYQG